MSRYLFGSGTFVTSMAFAILYADAENREKIEREYPQMVGAFYLNWDIPPEGFDSYSYNAKKIIFENSGL